MGAIGRAETGTEGMAKTSIEGTVETSIEGMVESGAVSVAGGVAMGIPTSTVPLALSESLLSKKIGIQNKGRPQQRGYINRYIKRR